MKNIQPEHPHDAGIEEETPDQSHMEGAELLANEARPMLRARGFSDDEIEEWAWTYISEEGSGDVASFIDWIVARERTS